MRTRVCIVMIDIAADVSGGVLEICDYAIG